MPRKKQPTNEELLTDDLEEPADMPEIAKRDLYQAMAKEEPKKELDQPELEPDDDEPGKPKSLDEALRDTPNLSDMQTALKRLFPETLGDDIANSVMVARISPDVFLPLLHLMTVSEIMQSDPRKPIRVVPTLAKYYTLLSIGLDGKGRIDNIELAGASREADELKDIGKGLF